MRWPRRCFDCGRWLIVQGPIHEVLSHYHHYHHDTPECGGRFRADIDAAREFIDGVLRHAQLEGVIPGTPDYERWRSWARWAWAVGIRKIPHL